MRGPPSITASMPPTPGHGASVSLATDADHDRTAIDFAVDNDDAPMTLLLLRNASSAREQILLSSALRGSLATFKACIAAGLFVDAANHNGATALILAASQNHSLVVKEALQNGANVNAKMKNGVTALIAAARGP